MIRAITDPDCPHVLKQLENIHSRALPKSWSTQTFKAHIKSDTDDIFGFFNPPQEPKDHDQLCGFIITRTIIDQSEILTFAVDKPHQRRGIGRALLGAVQTNILQRGSDIIFLDVAKNNIGAIALYESEGFLTYAQRPAYYTYTENGQTKRITAHLMQKRLAG